MRMKGLVFKIIYFFQIIVFYIFYTCYSIYFFFNKNKIKRKVNFIIGVDEIAGNIYFLGKVLENSITVCLNKNKFYDFEYDFSINISNKYLRFIVRILYGPILFSYLLHKSNNFFYIWHTGFFIEREFEFSFLKKRNKNIICMFCGDDIRSPKKMLDFFKSLDYDSYVEYYGFCNPKYLSKKYEEKKKKIANIADKYADLIFNAEKDQISYLKSQQFPWRYMYPKEKFRKNEGKFNKIEKIKIIHAPSNSIFKGTPLVRAAIKKLKTEGYVFDYIELQNVPNSIVLHHLETAHIVLNQFYGFVPGLLGVEAMAHYCAVLMSADPNIETSLPKDSKNAWIITKYWQIYDNLKYLLDNPEKIKYYARNGYDFAYKYYTYDAVRKYMKKIFEENSIL